VLPVLLNLSGRVVVVIGGGGVGMRKLSAVLESGATVRVVDPRPLPDLPSEVAHVAEPYRTEHVTGAGLVLACAPAEVNARVVADCRALGVWVNAATEPTAGDFVLPAVVRCGAFTLAVGTGGAAPALARRVRERLEREFDSAFAEWVRVLAEVRGEALAAVADAGRRRALLDSFADWPWLERLRADGADAVRAAMREQIERQKTEDRRHLNAEGT
jgi:precorrin-2 dehydrogenase/sirohydrochlorin ferrochelatase